MAIFSFVAENGSFSGAARALGIAPSRVSEAVSKLEAQLNTTLLNRTTRNVALTSEGRKLYAFTASMLNEAMGGLDSIVESKSEPSGSLNVSFPSYLTGSPLLAAVCEFSSNHPNVHIAISFHDNIVDPIKDGFDMCIRGGAQKNRRGFATQRLGELERVIVVGKQYYARKDTPKHPTDLASWDWVTYRHRERNFKLRAGHGRKRQASIRVRSSLQVDNLDALQFLTLQNAGASVMPLEVCRRGIQNGDLVRLFEDWQLSKVQQIAVWPEKTRRESLIALFVSFISSSLEK